MKNESFKKGYKTSDYDGMFKSFLENLSDEALKKFLSSVFGSQFKPGSKVQKLQQETQNLDGKRISDCYLKVDHHFYNIEIQTNEDETMALRMFEYGMFGAKLHGREEGDNYIKLTFPEPVVIYLRSSERTPTEFTIELDLPNLKINPTYNVPTIRMTDLSVTDLFTKSLYPLISFYPMKYEDTLKKPHDIQSEKAFIQDARMIIHSLQDCVQDKVLWENEANDIKYKLMDIMDNIIHKGNIIDEQEVKQAMADMEQITYRDAFLMEKMIKEEAHQQGLHEGRQEAAKEIKTQNVIRLSARDMKVEDIADITDLPELEILLLQKEHKDEIAKQKEVINEKKTNTFKNRNHQEL